MRGRFASILAGYELSIGHGIGALAALRDLVVDRLVQGERAYRIALLDLRHGVDAVKMLREVTRNDHLLGVIRWCDDWLRDRRPLVARAERELDWFSAAPALTGAGARTDDARRGLQVREDPDGSSDHPSSGDLS
jgi:hypothetical protein